MNSTKIGFYKRVFSTFTISLACAVLLCSIAAAKENSKPANKSASSKKSKSTNISSVYIGSAAGSDFSLSAEGASEKQLKRAVNVLKYKLSKLNKMLSTGDPKSEISRFAKSGSKSFKASLGFTIFMKSAERFRVESDGKFNINTGDLIDAWKNSAKSDKKPSKSELKKLVEQYKDTSFKINAISSKISAKHKVNIKNKAFIRAYIANKLAKYAQKYLKESENYCIKAANSACDVNHLVCTNSSNKSTQTKDIEVPIFYSPNATSKKTKDKPIAIANLNRKSLAFGIRSAGSVMINKKSYPLVLDPTTGKPACEANLVAVIDADPRAAAAWSQVFAMLTPKKAIKLAESKKITVLIIGADKKLYKNDPNKLFTKINYKGQAKDAEQATSSTLPASSGVTLKFNLIKPDGVQKYRKPTVAIWIETQNGSPIKTLEVWTDKKEANLFKLKDWASHGQTFIKNAEKTFKSPKNTGTYTVSWDGTNEKGRKLPPGKYKICIEIYRRAGKKCETDNYQKITKVFSLTGKSFSSKIDNSEETSDATIESN